MLLSVICPGKVIEPEIVPFENDKAVRLLCPLKSRSSAVKFALYGGPQSQALTTGRLKAKLGVVVGGVLTHGNSCP
jgi:hypothetical protein